MSVYNLVILAILDVGFRLFAKFLRQMLHFIMFCVLENIGLPGFWDKIRRKIILLFPGFGWSSFFLLHSGSGVSTRSNTRSTRCTHGPLIGLNEIAKRHWCLVFSVRAGYSNLIRATHSQLSRDQVAVTWVSRVLWRQMQHLHCRSRARDPALYYLSVGYSGADNSKCL